MLFSPPGIKKTAGMASSEAMPAAHLVRKDRDSNPGNSCPFTAFRVRPDRPLRHLSGCKGNAFSRRLYHPACVFSSDCRDGDRQSTIKQPLKPPHRQGEKGFHGRAAAALVRKSNGVTTEFRLRYYGTSAASVRNFTRAVTAIRRHRHGGCPDTEKASRHNGGKPFVKPNLRGPSWA